MIDLIMALVDFVLNIDTHLDAIIRTYGAWTYVILFLIIFCETGLVVTPFLPGDSLLFAAGAFAARGALDPWLLTILLIAAGVIGDTANYWIGHALGPRLVEGRSRFIKARHLARTHAFYEKHGGKTIVIARFVPIVRTFAPFVAGLGAMKYGSFVSYNCIGAVAWVTLFVWAGYFFGNIPAVEHNFTLVIFAIIFISLLPPLIEWIRARLRANRDHSDLPPRST